MPTGTLTRKIGRQELPAMFALTSRPPTNLADDRGDAGGGAVQGQGACLALALQGVVEGRQHLRDEEAAAAPCTTRAPMQRTPPTAPARRPAEASTKPTSAPRKTRWRP